MPNGDIVVSFRKTSVVAIVSRESGEIRWRWGPGEISHQHNASSLDNGRLLLFDNGAHRRGMDYSRVLEVEPFTGEIGWSTRATHPFRFIATTSVERSGCPTATRSSVKARTGGYLKLPRTRI